jgi:UDP-glucuronate 4-epimerase
MHLAAQAAVRSAMENPGSYVRSNIAQLGNRYVWDICTPANPQPSIAWASSSSVWYGLLNTKVPHSQSWTKLINLQVSMQQQRRLERKLLMSTYNHICGLSICGLQFFIICAPGVRPNMTYFSFTRDILNGKPINTYTKEPTTKIWLMISLTFMTLSKLDVLHLLMWWTKAQVLEGRRQVICGSAFLTLVS